MTREDFARNDVWIVVPAYNEEPRLEATLRVLGESGAQVVVVDDGSADATSAVALACGVWVLRHMINRGQGAALQTGIDFALRQGARVVVTFDADGQHSPADLDELVQPVLDGAADVVLGSRFLGGAVDLPRSRRLILQGGVLFTRLFSRIRVTDTHNGLRAFARHAAERIRLRHDGMAHASEILDQIRENGFRFREVPVTIRYTPETLNKGQTSWNAVKIVAQLFMGRVVR
jgi:glycosyltransferase involved in cell wall biosynthesis